MHAAHGHLLHQFLAAQQPAPRREYGGSLENRMRHPLCLWRSARQWATPWRWALRLSATDWVEGG
ncbi:hypothetical protein MJ579_14985 [Klebsiella pneumoniae]|nr:hypothetical protein MJ579_14985 [Klebsiella pneumoniae]